MLNNLWIFFIIFFSPSLSFLPEKSRNISIFKIVRLFFGILSTLSTKIPVFLLGISTGDLPVFFSKNLCYTSPKAFCLFSQITELEKGDTLHTLHITNNIQNSITLIPDFFIDNYLAKASGEFVKVYLYIQRNLKTGSPLTLPSIADSLYMTEADVRRALTYWQAEGVLQFTEPVPTASYVPPVPAVTDGPFQHTHTVPVKESLSPAFVADRMEEEGLSHLAFMADTYLGKPLSQTELNTLFYFYDRLLFPVDLIEYLLEYCVSNNKKSMRYIETVAISWYEQGINTIEKAKEAMIIYNKNYYAVMKAFGISNRNPGPAEAAFIKKWLEEYCFDLPIILEACNRTLSAISQPSFPYADSILGRWKKAQVHTLDDVKALDNQYMTARKNTAKPAKELPPASVTNRFHNFEQRDYNYQDLEQQFIRQVNGLSTVSDK